MLKIFINGVSFCPSSIHPFAAEQLDLEIAIVAYFVLRRRREPKVAVVTVFAATG
jgi:hypothetical protein